MIRFSICITPGIAKHLPKINFSSLRTPQEVIRCLCFTEIKTTALTNLMASLYPAMPILCSIKIRKADFNRNLQTYIFLWGYVLQLLVCLERSRFQLEPHFQLSPEIPHFSPASGELFLTPTGLDGSEGHLHCRPKQPLGLLFD